MANKKVTELPTNTSPSGSEIYAVEGGADYRLPVGGNNGISFLSPTGLVPAGNLGIGTADGTTYLRGDGSWAAIAGGGAGTVTSVSITPGTGLSVTGSPITTSGAFALSLSANLQAWSALATAAKADAAHTHSVTSLTATGTRDATTFLRGDNTWATPAGGGGGGVGTVTSVAVANVTGLTWTGSPITSSGTLTPALSANLLGWNALATSSKADSVHTHAAGDITSGIVATSRLGTGVASSSTYLRGDGTWAAVSGGSGGTVTSVTVSGSAGLTVGGTNPITSSGTVSLTLSATLQSWSGIDPTTKANTTHTHAAADITSGVMATARLGTGTANSTTYLRGDGTWAAVAAGGTGTVTSVAVADATGITWTGGPITTTGTLTPALSANLQSWSGVAPSTKANLASPDFTGVPTAPTVVAADNTNKVATTAYVKSQGYTANTGTVTSVTGSGGTTGLALGGGPITGSGTLTLSGTLSGSNGGTGVSSLSAGLFIYAATSTTIGFLTSEQVMTALGAAPLASPNFTGTPTILNADSTGTTRIPRTFVQSGDPGADAGDGDLWLF